MNDIASRIAALSPEQRAQLSSRLTAPPPADAVEPIAIIGVGCRFPGGAVSPATFWRRLLDGMDAVGEVPKNRWNLAGDIIGAARKGAFLDGVDMFDREFFGFSPRETVYMDPQQRLLLETAWEAIEGAGQMTAGLAESATGVFIGAHSHSSDYFLLQAGSGSGYDTYTATGSAHSILANRISFLLDLRGPSLTVDSACSSSLVAVHLACQSLRTGECTMAVAGGVNLMLTPDFFNCLSTMEMLAPDGRCKTFDERANGFVRGEGCGVIVLKRLADAQRNGDPVMAVILGSAVNQDGASNGLTAPNGLAQEAVIRRALAMAQVAPGEVSYVETHGTGTKLGDPIEIEVLARVLRPHDGSADPCVLGALKTNIGHLEGAAGIAGIIKVVLMLRAEQIPGNLHLQSINPHLAAFAARFTLPTVPQPWPRSSRRRVGGVSAFGFGGTNAHIVLTEAPRSTREQPAAKGVAALLLPISARSDRALRALAADYAAFLNGPGARIAPADLAYTAAHRRLHHDHRLCAVGAAPAEWAASLQRESTEGTAAPVRHGFNEVVFVFSGQGGLRAEPGAQVFKSEPVFRQVIEACDAALHRHAGLSLVDEMFAGSATSRIGRADVGQPVQFAMQAGLAALWRSWGVQPSRIIGHSLGEIAAANAAGVLSLDDAVMVAFHRGRILQEAAGSGGMAMVALSAGHAEAAIARYEPAISIAAINSPMSCILSGPVAALASLVAELQAQLVFARMLDTDYPSHSPLMGRFADALEAVLTGLQPAQPIIPIFSTVTGGPSQPGAFDAAYWACNLRQPVLFAQAMQTLVLEDASIFLEIGAQPTLRAAIEQCETTRSGPLTVATSLSRDLADDRAMAEGAATLYRAGVSLDWGALAPIDGQCVTLPGYTWDRQSYWLPKTSRPALSSGTDTAPAAWLYDLAWHQAERIGQTTSVLAKFNLNQSARRLTGVVAQFDCGTDGGDTLRSRLDVASAYHALRAFGDLGADLTYGARWSRRGLASRLEVQPRFERLLRRMTSILVEQDVLVEEADGWRVTGTLQGFSIGFQPIAANANEPAWNLLMRCGPQLAGVLRGNVEPLALLFGNDAASAEAIYRDAGPSRRSNEVLREAIKHWLADLQNDGFLRIIEIGAGTGATTENILPLLPSDRCEYVFTDVSPAFLTQAKNRFGDQPWIRYALLDLEQDLAEQGFAAGSFDLVIAANVLHATADISHGLVRIHDLLAGGGILALVECTAPRPWMDITFGLTDGWWRFADTKIRTDHPLLSERQWIDVLAASCFVGAEAIALQPKQGDPMFDQALVLGRKDGAEHAVAAPPRGRYLIVDQGSRLAAPLADRLRQRGDECQLVTADEQLPLDQLDGMRAFIYLAADTPPDLASGCSGLLTLAQLLIKAGSKPTRGLWIVTEGCQPGGQTAAAAVGQALLWGFGRGIAIEAPDLAPVLLDLDGAMAAAAAATIIEELDNPTAEDQIVRRGGARLVPRVQPLAATGLAGPSPTISGRHLITGGLGAIGSKLAVELARAGASELILSVSRPLPDRATWDRISIGDPTWHRVETVRKLEASGVKVTVKACDLTDSDALPALMTSSFIADAALNGVWHAAMLLVPQELATMDATNLAAMIAVKARAAGQLDQLTRSHGLEQFVLFSSTTGLWGARGLAHYAAANAYLDALAHARRAEGLPATAVDWGAWQITANASADHLSRAALAGLKSMPTGPALDALQQAVASGRAQTIIADVDWDQFRSVYEARSRRPLLSALKPIVPNDRALTDHASDDCLSRLRALAPQARQEQIVDIVKRAVAAVLGMNAIAPDDYDRGFFELGMDSLTTVQLRRQLEQMLARPLAATVAFKYPTITALSDHILDLVSPAAAAGPPATVARAAPMALVDEDHSSEDELFELLAARLSQGGA